VLIKRKDCEARRATLVAALGRQASGGLDRRTFLRRSGLVAGGVTMLGALSLTGVRKAEAGPPPRQGTTVIRAKAICTHCSVGCTVMAEVSNGVWIGQEPAWDSPINRGSHCAKGAAVRELVHGDRRLRYPVKLVNGQWTRMSWEQALDEISNKLMAIPESVYWLGSAKFSNEGAYLNRKLAAFWGTNNVDHQARICHSTTVSGVANTWGYGAMTNSYNDIRNAKTIIIMGGNPAEAHPVSLQHVLEGKELNRANMIVIDPRMTRTAAHATEYVRVRPGTHIPTIYGMLWHIFKNGWEDKEFHPPARLRHGRRPQGGREVASRRSRARHWLAGRAAQTRRRDICQAAAFNADLGDGSDTVHDRDGERPRQLHPVARNRQRGRIWQWCQHLPRSLQRTGCDGPWARCRHASALLRPDPGRLEALVPRLGR
jgi:formate dehydrogenase major subunit